MSRASQGPDFIWITQKRKKMPSERGEFDHYQQKKYPLYSSLVETEKYNVSSLRIIYIWLKVPLYTNNKTWKSAWNPTIHMLKYWNYDENRKTRALTHKTRSFLSAAGPGVRGQGWEGGQEEGCLLGVTYLILSHSCLPHQLPLLISASCSCFLLDHVKNRKIGGTLWKLR